MTNGTAQPPMAWRYCGNQVKLWRMRAGVSREVLGDKAGYEYETVKSMEQGRRRPSLRLLEVADELCGAQGLLLAAQEYLKPEKYEPFSVDFMRYEAEAIALNSYEPLLIPGLLQTEETARALISSHWPPLDDETIDERVAARLERHSMLEKQTRAFAFVIGEAPLRNAVDTVEAHKLQLLHLLAGSQRRNVTIQVMPSNRGAHPGLNGPYVLLETADHEHLAYEEGQTTGVLYAAPEKVSVVSQRHSMILQQALGPEETACWIRKLAEDL